MAYDPMFYNPYLNRPLQQSQQVNGLVRIESIDDAKVYQLPPNSVSPPLFLGSENAFFIKTTDASGGGTLKKNLWVTVEEWSAEFMERHALEATTLAAHVLGRPLCIRGLCN